jgi:hypothetical protein
MVRKSAATLLVAYTDLGLIGERSWKMTAPMSSKSWWCATASRTFPYSSDVPAVSSFSSSRPCATIDWSRFNVPTTFAITVSYGRCHDSPTCACAARWKT